MMENKRMKALMMQWIFCLKLKAVQCAHCSSWPTSIFALHQKLNKQSQTNDQLTKNATNHQANSPGTVFQVKAVENLTNPII